MEVAVLTHTEPVPAKRLDVHHQPIKAKGNRPISPAERRILSLAVKGYTDKEICKELNLSITTVRTHWTRLRRKLGVVNRAQAIAESMEMESGEQLRLLQARVKAMHRALNLRGLGVWEWHLDSDCIVADELSTRIFRRTFDNGTVRLGEFLCSLPQDDRANLASHLREPKLNGSMDGITHRVRVGNSGVLLVRTKATRVACDDKTIVVCTTETLSQV